MRAKGIATVAREIGFNRSALSLVVNGKRSPSAELMRRLREFDRNPKRIGGAGVGSVFADCAATVDFALAYLKLGFSVIPIRRGEKTPLVKWKHFRVERPTATQVRQWWRMWPDANVAVVTGPVSDLFAIDVDGKEAYDVLIDRLGGEPDAPKVLSGSGVPYRMHFYFLAPRGSLPKLKSREHPWHPSLEVFTNAYLVLPPSVHKSGNSYRWAEGRSIEHIALPQLPEPILRSLIDDPVITLPRPTRSRPRAGAHEPAFVREFLNGTTANARGGRNSQLFKVACFFAEHGQSVDQILRRVSQIMEFDDDAHLQETEMTIGSAAEHVRSKRVARTDRRLG